MYVLMPAKKKFIKMFLLMSALSVQKQTNIDTEIQT